VEFAIILPNEVPEKTRYFVVELAPLNTVPHAVHLFLNQVAHKLWDNTWFYINGPHVLQAGPQAEESEIGEGETERMAALRPFKKYNLDSLAFPEYSDKFSHVPWTLGFTGRPGGPDFYINKVDNTAGHGPGGQFHHELGEFADSCFARVVKGFDTLERLTAVDTIDSGDFRFFFDEPVQISRAIVLSKPVKEDWEELAKRKNGFLPFLEGPVDTSKESSRSEAEHPREAEPVEKENDRHVEEHTESEGTEPNQRRSNRKKFRKHMIENQVEP
jgi:cyclophilin family peptidyl-prolyl cis-trans isomerase